MLAHDEADRSGVIGAGLLHGETEFEARAHPREVHNFVAVNFACRFLAARAGGHGNRGIGMRVIDVRVGDDIAPHLIARRLAHNHRILCAAPAYLAQHGTPRSLDELKAHACLAIKEREHPFGVWRLQSEGREQVVKVQGPLSSNDGDVALRWALDGRGILLRSMWQAAPLLASGALVPVLPGWEQPANIWAVYPVRLERSAKLRAAVEFLVQWFKPEAVAQRCL